MSHCQPETENRSWDRVSVDLEFVLVEVSPTLSVHEERKLSWLKLVRPVSSRVVEAESAQGCVSTVDGRHNGVTKSVAGRVLVIVEIAGGTLSVGAGI